MMRYSILFAVMLLGTALLAEGQQFQTSVNVVSKGKRKCVIVNGVAGKEYDEVGTPITSADGQHVAYVGVTHRGLFSRTAVSRVVLDGEEQEEFDSCGTLHFGPQGHRLVYAAMRGERTYVVIDGRAIGPYEQVEQPILYMSDEQQIARIVFSPDGKRIAYSALKRTGEVLVVDGVESTTAYRHIADITFSPDSQRVSYQAVPSADPGGTIHYVVDDRIGPPCKLSKTKGFFTKDSKHFVYIADTDRWAWDICGADRGGDAEEPPLDLDPAQLPLASSVIADGVVTAFWPGEAGGHWAEQIPREVQQNERSTVEKWESIGSAEQILREAEQNEEYTTHKWESVRGRYDASLYVAFIKGYPRSKSAVEALKELIRHADGDKVANLLSDADVDEVGRIRLLASLASMGSEGEAESVLMALLLTPTKKARVEQRWVAAPLETATIYTYQTGKGASPYSGPTGAITTQTGGSGWVTKTLEPAESLKTRYQAAACLFAMDPLTIVHLLTDSTSPFCALQAKHAEWADTVSMIARAEGCRLGQALMPRMTGYLQTGTCKEKLVAVLACAGLLEVKTTSPAFGLVASTAISLLEGEQEDVRQASSAALERMTDQTFGEDAARWRAWVSEHQTGGSP